MVMELSRMEPVAIRKIWPHEEHTFTPWLADNLDLLNDTLGMDWVLVGTEQDVPGAGRADIIVQQSGVKAIIENQLEPSDDDHFIRALHYAANVNAQTLIWVAPSFDRRHREILQWLTANSKLNMHCIELSVWKIGEHVAPQLRTVVPSGWIETPEIVARREYQRFYGPLSASLRSRGLEFLPTEPDMFQGLRYIDAGYEDVYFVLTMADDDGKAWVWLSLERDEDRLQMMAEHQSEMEAELPGLELLFGQDDDGCCWLGFSAPATMEGTDDDQEETRQWMLDNLLLFRAATTPWLIQTAA